MDAFYASVELLRYPELRGKPVVIGGGRRHQPDETTDPGSGHVTRAFATLRGYVGRGVITTATYEARALGLHSAQGLMKAAQLAPDAILLPTDFDRYRDSSRRFKDAVQAIAPQIEDRGIDEIYIDLTGVRLPDHDTGVETPGEAWWRARDVAKQAARQDFLGARQARWPDHAGSRRCRAAHLAAARAQDQRRRPEGKRQARGAGRAHHRRARSRRSALAGRTFRQKLRRVAARGGQRTRRSAGGDVQRAQIDQPRDDIRTRSPRDARPRSAVGDIHRALRRRRRRSSA